jgi:hypothetical protein
LDQRREVPAACAACAQTSVKQARAPPGPTARLGVIATPALAALFGVEDSHVSATSLETAILRPDASCTARLGGWLLAAFSGFPRLARQQQSAG